MGAFIQKNLFWLLCLLLVGAVAVAYGNVYGNAFLYDDEFLIVKNRFLTSWAFLPDIFSTSSTAGFGGHDSFFRPLQIFLYLITTQFFGGTPAAFHGLNVLLHAANAVLVFVLFRRLGLTLLAGFCVALLWALHPVHTEAVTYMSATADVLYSFFVLLGLVFWRTDHLKARLISLACFFLALLSKETAIVFPALLCVLLFFEQPRPLQLKTFFPSWPFWLMAGLYLLARATILDFDDSYTFYTEDNDYTRHLHLRVLTFLSTLTDYARFLLWPADLHMDRLMPLPTGFFLPKVLWGSVFLVLWGGLTVLFLTQKKNEKLLPLIFAGAWFLAAYFPQSGILVPMNALILEHWLYLPSTGLLAGAALFLVRTDMLGKGMGVQGLLVLSLLSATVLGMVTHEQNRVWQTPLTFYPHILKYETGSARVFNNLAMAYEEAGQAAEAESTYRKAIATWDVYPQTHYNLGNLLLKNGAVEDAEAHYRRALELDARFTRAASMLAQLARARGDTQRAGEYEKMLEEGK